MTESRYEKYVARKPMRPQGIPETSWTMVKGSMTAPPFIFLDGDTPIKGTNTMLETMWVWKDTAVGISPERPPHKHECDEIFLFMGTNGVDSNDLGAEIEMWLGEGEEAEKIAINTSSVVFVPSGLVHLPIIFNNVSKPILLVVIGINASDMKIIKCALREL